MTYRLRAESPYWELRRTSGGTRTSAGMGRVSVHPTGTAATNKSIESVVLVMTSPIHPDAQPETDAAQIRARELRVEDVHEASLQREAPLEVRVDAALQIEGVSLVARE